MKISTLLLSASLAANLALAAAFLASRPAATTAPAPSATSKSTTVATPAANADTSAFPSSTVRLAASGGPSLWQQLHTGDFEQLLARLKQAGFPGATANALAMHLFQEKNRADRAAIMGEPDDLPYWKDKIYVRPTPEQQARLNELSKAQSDVMMKSYFDADYYTAGNSQMSIELRRVFGELPPGKIQQLLRIQQDYARMHSDIAGPSGVITSSTDPANIERQKKSALLEKELHADVRELLSPEEFAEFERRSSPTASRLQQQTSLFRPTEQEYKALFAIHRAIDEQLGVSIYNFSSPSAETEKSRVEALKNAAPQLEAALGPDRYADYVQATEGVSQLNRLVTRLNLPLRAAARFESARKDIITRVNLVRADNRLPPAERDLRLAELTLEAKERFTTALGGQRGFTAYESMAGDWLKPLGLSAASP